MDIQFILLEGIILEVLILILILLLRKGKVFKKKIAPEKETFKEKVKKPKIEQIFVFMIYLLVFSVAGYFFIGGMFPNNPINTSGVYELSAGDVLLTSKLKSLYLKEDNMLGGKTEEDLRMIISEEPMKFVFNPKKIIAENSTAEIELSLVEIRGSGTDVYLNDKLIIPDLSNYELIKDYQDESVYIKKSIEYDNLESQRDDSGEPQEDNAEDFIYKNFPQATIYSFKGLSGGMPVLQDYEKTETKIDTTFRDNLKLAVYTEGYLEIEFTKQDLNGYVGKDEYTVTIKDYNGEIVFSKVYEDDGNKKDDSKKGEEQDFKIKEYNLEKGVYYIDFIKDKNNKYADSTVKDIEINSNKVLITGNILPLNEFEFYTKVFSDKTIGFLYWWDNKYQKIYQTGTEKNIINLNEDWKSKKYEQNLTKKGDYYFEINTGYLWVYCDAISPTKENWFNIPISSEKKLLNSDIIIIDKDKLKINDNNYLYKEIIEIKEKQEIKLQVLDRLRIYFKDIKLTIN